MRPAIGGFHIFPALRLVVMSSPYITEITPEMQQKIRIFAEKGVPAPKKERPRPKTHKPAPTGGKDSVKENRQGCLSRSIRAGAAPLHKVCAPPGTSKKDAERRLFCWCR